MSPGEKDGTDGGASTGTGAGAGAGAGAGDGTWAGAGAGGAGGGGGGGRLAMGDCWDTACCETGVGDGDRRLMV